MSKPLRLGFNGRTFSSDRVRGFTRHTVELLKALQVLPDHKDIHLFSDRPMARIHQDALAALRFHRSRVRPHLAWEQASLPVEMAMHRIEVFHSTTNIGVPIFPVNPVKRVVTVHDLITLDQLERGIPRSWRGLKARASYEVSWQATLLADAVITVSRYSADQIERRFPQLGERIQVIPNGGDGRFAPGAVDRDLLVRYGLTERGYLLYVGGFEERKNVRALVRAYRAAFEGRKDAPLLALVGDFSEASEALLRLSQDETRVRWLGYVPDEELIRLYRGALCSVVPSRDEGFGFQALEAMACGNPVLCSNATSLPEVGGDAVAYFQPDDTEALKALLIRAVSEPEWLRALSEKGLIRARTFTWMRAAEATFAIYRALAL
ncbi:MAG: glycosyltransferase family 4 protein [Oligoflexia bacterium]|nr:glycosyltransferase family 4 protein [Oligoflexia bacterium]